MNRQSSVVAKWRFFVPFCGERTGCEGCDARHQLNSLLHSVLYVNVQLGTKAGSLGKELWTISPYSCCIYFVFQVFEKLLLDHDWSLNAGNWMWLSASAFFHAYFRVYSPVAFGKKTDPNGEYIK